jgi:hypothetical protein
MRSDHRDLLAPHRLRNAMVGLFRQIGWPPLLGLLAIMTGLALLLAAWQVHQQTRHLHHASDATPSAGTSDATQGRQFARATEAIFTIPEDRTHIDDLDRLFKLAKSKGVQIGTVEYRQTPSPSLQALVRTLDVRIHEDYPRLKGFVAELLGSMPHVSLQEIRVERKDATVTQGQVLLKLSFVYRASGTSITAVRATP